MTFREFMRENGYELQTTFWTFLDQDNVPVS